MKELLDQIAIEAHGWSDDARKTYVPDELPSLIRRLRAKAARWLAWRENNMTPLADAWDRGYAGYLRGESNPYRDALDGARETPDCEVCAPGPCDPEAHGGH